MTQLEEIEAGAADGIISVGEDGRLTHFNAAAEGIFGYKRDEVIGQPLTILLPEDRRRGHHAYMRAFAASGEAARTMGERAPVVGRRKDGSVVPLEISILHHKSPGPRRFTAVLRDISRRVAQERALAEKERKFRAIFDGSYQFVALLDTDGNILELNRSAIQFIGGNQQTSIGSPLWQAAFWTNEVERSSLREAVLQAAEGKFSHLILDVQGENGRTAKLDLALKAIQTPLHSVEFLIAEGRDVTELVDINEALRRSEARLANAQKIARLGNWEWTLASNQLLWSDEVYRIFGLTPDTFGASYDAFIGHVHPDDRQLVQNAVDRAIAEKEPYSIQHRVVCPDGTEKVVHERGEVLFDDDGKPLVMTGTVQDVTEAWAREQALARARDDAEAANRAKSLFLAAMSHELRTPLNAIIGFSEIMTGEMFGAIGQPAYKEYSNYILDSGQHLLKIINDILDVTRIESGASDAIFTKFDPEKMIEAAVRFIRAKADAKGIVIRIKALFENYRLYLDERLCKQILINLLGNAVKFTDSGGCVEIGLKATDEKVSFIVRDTGIGISQDHLHRVFEPFFQVEGAFARKYDGVGLGLTIVKNLVELQGGRVAIASKRGAGTTVTVDFPIACLIIPERSELRRVL